MVKKKTKSPGNKDLKSQIFRYKPASLEIETIVIAESGVNCNAPNRLASCEK